MGYSRFSCLPGALATNPIIHMSYGKIERVTAARLADRGYYRVQVHLEDNRYQALCYLFVCWLDPKYAAVLRDSPSPQLQETFAKAFLESVNGPLGDKLLEKFFADFVDEDCRDRLQALAQELMKPQ